VLPYTFKIPTEIISCLDNSSLKISAKIRKNQERGLGLSVYMLSVLLRHRDSVTYHLDSIQKKEDRILKNHLVLLLVQNTSGMLNVVNVYLQITKQNRKKDMI
jgi:hypothetical protein